VAAMKTHINLIPESFLRRRLVRRWSIRWLCAWGLSALACFSYLGLLEHAVSLDDQINASLQAKAKPVLEMSDAAQRFREELRSVEADDALLRRLTGEGSPLDGVGLTSVAAAACGGRIWVQRLRIETRFADESSSKPGPPTGRPASPGVRRMTLSGVAADNLAVAEFVAALRSANAFRRVELKNSLGGQFQGVGAWNFEIESEL
jgi:hypothetical protein